MMLASVIKKLGRIDEAIVEWQRVARDGALRSVLYDEPIGEMRRENYRIMDRRADNLRESE